MKKDRRWAIAVVTAILGFPARSGADEHLVQPKVVGVRLSEAAEGRSHDLAAVQGVLSSPQAADVAKALGVDISAVQAAVPGLNDGELRDLAARAAALDRDPPAGLTHDVNRLLVIFLIVAIVVLLLSAL